MAGTLTGRVGKKKRKYRHPKSKLGVRKNSIYNRYVDAQSLEDAVLGLILRVAEDVPDMRQRVADALKGLEEATADEGKLQGLQEQRNDIAKRLQMISLTMTDDDLDDIMPALDMLRRQRRSIDAQIEKISGRVNLSSVDPDEIIEAVISRMTDLPSQVVDLDIAVRRDLVEAFVDKVVIDMETKDAEVYLRLPQWALKTASGRSGSVSLAHSSLSPTVDETHPLLSVSLGFADCKYQLGQRSVCYQCRRRAA